MTTPRHLVTVWNPAYASSALEAHLRLLLERDARVSAQQASEDDCYVCWDKVRSLQRWQPMPHLADVGLITTNDVATNDASHVPPFDAARKLSCDCWFMLRDIRALVRDDLEGVVLLQPGVLERVIDAGLAGQTLFSSGRESLHATWGISRDRRQHKPRVRQIGSSLVQMWKA